MFLYRKDQWVQHPNFEHNMGTYCDALAIDLGSLDDINVHKTQPRNHQFHIRDKFGILPWRPTISSIVTQCIYTKGIL